MILTVSNYKLKKAWKETNGKYMMAGLSLAPSIHSGYNTCAKSTPGCREACVLWFTGRSVMSNVRNAMIRRTKMFYEDREKFKEILYHDTELFAKYAKRHNAQPVIRLNIASDLPFENIFPEIFQIPDCKFMDYTKIEKRFDGVLPPNYELTYSMNENSNTNFVKGLLNSGNNVAIVTNASYRRGILGPIPSQFKIGSVLYPAVDGDITDLRLKEVDGSGVCVLLRFKGSKKRLNDGLKSKFVKQC